MKTVFIVLMAIFTTSVMSQEKQKITASQMATDWVISVGSFPDENITLKKVDAKKEVTSYFTSYFFKEDSTVGYHYHLPKGIGMCGTGRPYISESEWTLEGNELKVFMKGRYFAKENINELKAVYIVESYGAEVLKLKRKELISSK